MAHAPARRRRRSARNARVCVPMGAAVLHRRDARTRGHASNSTYVSTRRTDAAALSRCHNPPFHVSINRRHRTGLRMEPLDDLVRRAQQGDVQAYGKIVEATERMVLAVSCQVLRDAALAQDAAQETYLRVFRRVREVQ